MNDKSKHLYSFKYTIPAVNARLIAERCIEELTAELIEVKLEAEGFVEANAVIARIKAM